MMKKICMVAYTYYLSDPRVRREAEALADRGDMVDFICLQREGEKKREIVNGVSLYRLSIRRYRGSGIFAYMIGYLSFFVFSFFKVNFLYFKKRYNLIQVHTMPDFLIFIAFIPKLFGSKVVLDMHDLMPELYISKFKLNEGYFIIQIIKWIEKLSARFADRIITVTDLWRNRLIDRTVSPEKCSILLNVADGNIFDRKKQPDNNKKNGFKLMYHGTLVKRYGVDIAIKAVNIAGKEIDNLEFDILGEGDDQKELLSLICQLNLENSVYLTGKFVPVGHLPEIILQADIGIVPNRADGFTNEVLNTKLLEYVALGIPVVAARTKGVEAYFDNSMVDFFEPGDEEDLARCILDLYRNPAKRKQLALNANRFNEKYNWSSQKKVYYQLIDNL